MYVIRIRHKAKIHTRIVTRNFRGTYLFYSKGNCYQFERTDDGWTITQGELSDTFLYQIFEQLEEIYQSRKGNKI